MKKPKAVTRDTNTAAIGDMNIAMKIGTWLANVKDAGSMIIFAGEYIGMMIPIALSIAEITMVKTLFDTLLFVI